VVVHATIESCRGILAKPALNKGLASRVLVDEISHVIDNTRNSNKTATAVD
jgi:hypothetical protein